MFDDISFLVQETFNGIEANRSKGFFTALFDGPRNHVPETSGVLYHLQQQASTFVIRIHACEDLAREHASVLKHPGLFPGLRLADDFVEKQQLRFFECDSFDLAKALKQGLAHKRFPVYEENVFNVSDPSDSWWMAEEQGIFNLYFKLSHTEKLERLIKLGPLGSREIYQDLFVQLRGYFNEMFPLQDYFCGNDQLEFKVAQPQSPLYRSLVHLFEKGEIEPSLFEFMRNWESSALTTEIRESVRKANYILIELATIRSFWLQIQNQLFDSDFAAK